MHFWGKAIIRLSMTGAIALSAAAAQGIPAAASGTTAFTCEPVPAGEAGTEGFKDTHCKEGATGTSVAFEHVEIPGAPTTESSLQNLTTGGERESAVFESKVSAIPTRITAKKVEGSASMTNVIDPKTGEHYAVGEGALEFLEVEMPKPAEKGCKIAGGKIVTKDLAMTTKEQGDFVKISPAEGNVLAEFTVEGCAEALKGVWEITGSFKAPTTGATITTTASEITAQKTLLARGNVAGFGSSLTISGRANPEESYTPIAATTGE